MTTLEFYEKVGHRAFSDAEKGNETPGAAIAVQKGIENTGNLPRVLLSLFSKAHDRNTLEIVTVALCAGVHIGAASAKDIIEEEGLAKMMGVEK